MAKERQKPLLIRAQEIQEDGSVVEKTINAADLKLGKPKHDKLPPALAERAARLFWTVGRYARPDLSLGGWIAGFCSDANPESEIGVWEHIHRAVDQAGGDAFVGSTRGKVIRVFLLISMNAVDIESQTGMPEEQVNKCRAMYEAAATQ